MEVCCVCPARWAGGIFWMLARGLSQIHQEAACVSVSENALVSLCVLCWVREGLRLLGEEQLDQELNIFASKSNQHLGGVDCWQLLSSWRDGWTWARQGRTLWHGGIQWQPWSCSVCEAPSGARKIQPFHPDGKGKALPKSEEPGNTHRDTNLSVALIIAARHSSGGGWAKTFSQTHTSPGFIFSNPLKFVKWKVIFLVLGVHLFDSWWG